jgi:hypothetical protein
VIGLPRTRYKLTTFNKANTTIFNIQIIKHLLEKGSTLERKRKDKKGLFILVSILGKATSKASNYITGKEPTCIMPLLRHLQIDTC